MSEQTRANGNKCWAVTGPKWSIFNSAHRQIHLHKESPITYNPSAERTSDLTSTFYAVSRPAIALWTWQIAYWSADVVANVLSARAAAATCPKLHGSPAESSASPIPTFQSLHARAPPSLPAGHPPHPSSFLPCPPRCGRGHRQTPSAPTGRKWQVRPASGHVTWCRPCLTH